MRKKVALLRQEEGFPIDERMLTKRFYHVLFTGLRDDNVRAELRERLEGRTDKPDNEIIKLLADIVAVEAERKEKLFGNDEKEEVSVNVVRTKEAKTPVKKQRENPFALIEELRVAHQKEMTEMRKEMNAQLSEIQKSIVSGNMNANASTFIPNQQMYAPNTHTGQPSAQFQQQQQFQQAQAAQPFAQYGQPFAQYGQQPLQQPPNIPLYGNNNRPWAPKKKPFKMCDSCTAQNATRCDHCWKCGGAGHKSEGGKNKECPKNQ